MKIGLVCPYSMAKHGGVQEVILSLKDGLEKRGHHVKILTPKPSKKEVNHDDIIFVSTSTDFRSPMSTTTQWSNTSDNEQIDAMLAEEKFDILHFHEPWQPLFSRQLLQRSTSVNIATFHSKLPETMMSRTVMKAVTPYLKSVMKYLDVLTAVSASGAEYAASLTNEPITLIPNGIDLTKYRSAATQTRPSDQRKLLYIGRLERRKGVRYLLQAYQLLSQDNPDVELIIAGDGPERERLEMMVDDLHLPSVSFLGYISDDLKIELLDQADLFCTPAVFGESFGIVLLEAMAMNTVAVAGNNSGYVDLMQDQGALSIVNPHDTTEFARRLDTMLNQEDIRKLWLKWAKSYVRQYNYPQVIKQYEELYKEALANHG